MGTDLNKRIVVAIQPGTSAGFTLLETIIVLVLMVCLAVAIPPIIQWASLHGVHHAVDILQADLQKARCMAISQNRSSPVRFNHPADNSYASLISGATRSLGHYRGGVHFLPRGPDGRSMAQQVIFTRMGMSSSVLPADVYIAGENDPYPYRIRVLLPGGISVSRWNGRFWK